MKYMKIKLQANINILKVNINIDILKILIFATSQQSKKIACLVRLLMIVFCPGWKSITMGNYKMAFFYLVGKEYVIMSMSLVRTYLNLDPET